MDSANPNPFFGGTISSKPMSLPHIIANIPTSGLNTTAHVVVGTPPISGGLTIAPTIPTVP